MKPFKIVLGIVGATVLLVSASAIKSKLNYDNDGREIVKLIAEYKGWGVPTTNAEYEKLYPEIGLSYEQSLKHIDASVNTYRTNQLFTPEQYLLGVTKNDSLFVEKYLRGSSKTRKDSSASGKLGLDFIWNRCLVQEFCLAALLESYRGDLDGMTADLNESIRIANYNISGPGDCFFGVFLWRSILQTFLRIIEQSPTMTPKILAMMENRNLISMINARSIVYQQFLQNIITARHLDTPLLDKARPPALLRRLIKVPTDEEILESLKEHDDDYVPVSRTGRFLLRERLESWKPVIIKTAKARYPSVQPDPGELEKASSFSHSVPSDLVKLFNQDDHLTSSKGIFQTDTDFRILLQIVTNALKAKAITGRIPDTLAQVAPSVSPSDYRYQTIRDGFAAEIIWHDAKRPSFVHYRISFPLDYSIGAKRIAAYRASIARAQKLLKSSKTP